MAPSASEEVLVVGAGIAGLCVALALAPTGRRITLLERDAPPPGEDQEAAFEDWNRRGASQLRHSHAFLARLRNLIADEHPALLEALHEAGTRELTFKDGLPAPLRDAYVPEPGDERMTILVSRRSTLEWVMRRHVESLPGVTIRSGSFVEDLITEPSVEGATVARGLLLQGGEALRADLVIDAGGRGSRLPDWLEARGLDAPEDSETCAILYYTRFYRLLDDCSEPTRGEDAANGDLGYLKFGVFPADAGTFSITLAVPEVEESLRAVVVRPDVFDAICGQLPGVARWVEPDRAEPVSKVHAMGDLTSRWREMAPGGRAVVHNLFAVGDSVIRTNPLFGRGCSFAAVEAHLLRDVLAETNEPDTRADLYSRRLGRELRPFFEEMRTRDREAAGRALRIMSGAEGSRTLRRRLAKWLIEDGIAVAVRRDTDLLREALRAFHMLEPPRAWLGRPRNLAKIAATLARGRRANAPYRPRPAGPNRPEMFERLGLA